MGLRQAVFKKNRGGISWLLSLIFDENTQRSNHYIAIYVQKEKYYEIMAPCALVARLKTGIIAEQRHYRQLWTNVSQYKLTVFSTY